MRAFTAVDLDDPELLERLEDLQREIDCGFNLVEPNKMHVTLQFFRRIDGERLEAVKRALEDVELSGFRMDVNGLGVFPSRDRIRVVWAGVESEKIYELKSQVSDHRVEDDSDHDFHPHVTLARIDSVPRRDRKNFREDLESLKDVEIGTQHVEQVKLFESRHTGKTTEYVERYSKNL